MGIRVVHSPMVRVNHEVRDDKRCTVRLTLEDDHGMHFVQEFGIIYGPTMELALMRAQLVVSALNNNLERIGLK